MKRFFKPLYFAVMALALCSILSSCGSGKDPRSKEIYTIHLFENNPYLAEIWWGKDYDPQAATEFLNKRYNTPAQPQTEAAPATGGCSSWHKDNFHGRNIDWTMKEYATLIIHMPRNEAKGVKYASVSLIAGNPAFTKDFIQSNKEIPEEFRNWVPASVVDGMNECGLAINHNIVPYDGRNYESNGDLASLMVCRYVLDNFATAKEAVDSLANMKITQAVVKIAHDYSHFFLSDATSSYVVEWIDGEFVATEFKSDGNGNYVSGSGMPAIMTNYFVGMAEKYGLGSPEFYKMHSYAAGVERTNTIKDLLPSAKTLADHLDICKAVWYRQFCQGKTEWATENAGVYGYSEEQGKAYWCYPTPEDMHWMENDDVYAAAVDMIHSDAMKNYYNDFNTNWDKCDPDNTYWYTQHSVVYDLKAKKGYVIMQEGLFSPDVIEINI